VGTAESSIRPLISTYFEVKKEGRHDTNGRPRLMASCITNSFPFYLFSVSLSVFRSGLPQRQEIFSCNPNIVSINFLQTHISPPLWCPIQDRTAEMYVPWKNIVTTRMGLYLLRH